MTPLSLIVAACFWITALTFDYDAVSMSDVLYSPVVCQYSCKPVYGRTIDFFTINIKVKDDNTVEVYCSDFKDTVDRLADRIKPNFQEALILSNEGCGRCKTCIYPDAPCRFPDKLYPSIEGFGFIVSELAKLPGSDTITAPIRSHSLEQCCSKEDPDPLNQRFTSLKIPAIVLVFGC